MNKTPLRAEEFSFRILGPPGAILAYEHDPHLERPGRRLSRPALAEGLSDLIAGGRLVSDPLRRRAGRRCPRAPRRSARRRPATRTLAARADAGTPAHRADVRRRAGGGR